jgi:spoIIIJ-associated protein
MMKSYRFETKEINDQALKLAASELKISKDYVSLKIVEEKKGFLSFNKSYVVEATINFDVAKDSVQYLQTLITNMEIEAYVEAKMENERQIVFIIEAKENPLLIGKNGKTLDALQILVKNFINNFTDEHYVALVDVGGYKEQRKKQIEIIATKTAKEVAKSRIKARLGKMNAYERRVVHTKLADWRDVVTESEGEEPNRYVVIKPKNK